MLSRTSTFAGRASAALVALGLLLLGTAHPAAAAINVDRIDTLSAVIALRPCVSGAAVVSGAADAPAAPPASPRAGESAWLFAASAAAASPALAARLPHAFGADAGVRAEGTSGDWAEVLLGNGDAFVRANLPLTVSNHWRSFVYADLGAADSELRWQGLAGMHHRLGIDLLAGWRHVTYHFSPGRGFDSLEFKGPYLGASLAW